MIEQCKVAGPLRQESQYGLERENAEEVKSKHTSC